MNQELQLKSRDFKEIAFLARVSNDYENKRAADLVKECKELQKNIRSSFDPIIQKAHESHKEAISQRDVFLNPLVDSEKKLKEVIGNYLKEKERLIFLERIKQEEEQRNLILKAQELKRNSASLGESMMADLDCENAEKEIEKINKLSIKDQAKVKGIQTIRTFKAFVVDESIIPREYLVVDNAKLSVVARSYKEGMQIPGIEFREDIQIRVR